MARYKVMAVVEERNIKAAQAAMAAAFKGLDPERIGVEKINPSPSRADRLGAALAEIENAKSEVESLRDEIQEWHDNMPENLQDGEKGQALDECGGALEAVIEGLDTAISEGEGIDFPSMM